MISQTLSHFTRTFGRRTIGLGMCLLLVGATAETQAVQLDATPANGVPITDFGAVADGITRNTKPIQVAIDHLAAKGGGTLIIPKGIFLSGALFLKPGVNLYLSEGAVLKGSSDIQDYPKSKTRIEGHSEEWTPALINADRVDHLHISGSGTLDGSGASAWKEFLDRRKVDPKLKNLDVPRPRLVFVQDCKDVHISGITFLNSSFWNLHLYRCQGVTVENDRFEVPDKIRCPCTDGTDIDSSQDVTIRACTYRVDDDCIALKGSKGPFALDDKDSPPTEHIRITDCTFERGGGILTLGSEATVVRDVVAEHCTVRGASNVVYLKLRPDTPQDYEDIHFHDITLDGATGTIVRVQPWKQYFDLKGQPPPKSVVRNVTLSDIKGHFGSFGTIEGNRGQSEIGDVLLENITVELKHENFKTVDVKNLTIKNVSVNGKPLSE